MKWNTYKDINKDVVNNFNKIYEEKNIRINGCNHHMVILRSNEPVLFHTTYSRYFIGYIQVQYTTNLEKTSETDVNVCYIYNDHGTEITESSSIEWVFLSDLLYLGGLK